MDLIIGFLFGFFLKDISFYLKRIVNYYNIDKELLTLILEGQQDINKRIDELHEKVNQKISRQELSGWLVAISALVVLINNLM